MHLRLLVTLLLLLSFAHGAHAQQAETSGVNVSGLTAEQVKALSVAADELRKQPANTIASLSLQNTTPAQWTEWAEAGTAAGKAVGNFSKEVGIAADQFLKTDVGRISLYALIWKFGGDKVVASVINLLSGFVLAAVLLTFWWKLTRLFVFNIRRTKKVDYNQNTLLRWLGFNKMESALEKNDEWLGKWSADDQWWLTFWSRVLSICLLVVIVLLSWPRVSF